MTVTMMSGGRGKPLTKKRVRSSSRSMCSIPGCVKTSQSAGVCCEHGARTSRSTCSFPRCRNTSQRGGLCRRHGSDRLRICTVEECPRVGRYCGVHSGIIPTRELMTTTAPIPPPADAAAVVVVAAAPPTRTQGGQVSSPSSTTSDAGFPPPVSLPPQPPSSSGLKCAKSMVEKEFYTNLAQAVIRSTNDKYDSGFAPPHRSHLVGGSFQGGCSHDVRSTNTRGLNTNPIVNEVVVAQAQAVVQQQHNLQTSLDETNNTAPQGQACSGAFSSTTLGELVSAFSVEAQVEEKYNETHCSSEEFDVSSRVVDLGGGEPNKLSNASSWVIPAVIPTAAATSHEHGQNPKNALRLVQLAIPSINSDEINDQNFRTARILHAARMAVIRAATKNVASRLSATTATTTTCHPLPPSPPEQGQRQYYSQAIDDTVFHSPSSARQSSLAHFTM